MATVCRGGADVTLWMMRLDPPMEVMVGTVSTLTTGGQSQCQQSEAATGTSTSQRMLTFDLGMLPILLWLTTLSDDGGWLRDDSGT